MSRAWTDVAQMKPRSIVLLLALFALLAKLYCALTTTGSTDVLIFFQFARFIDHHGLIAMYKETPLFNHTPIVGWFSEAVSKITLHDKDPRDFAFLLRLPAIFSDLAGVLALLWLRNKTGRPAWWAIAIFAASPVGFMISGYHGNVDSLVALGILLAGIACAVEKPELSGLFLGLACNVKIIPILFAPAFFFFWWQRGRAWRFAIPATATVLIGWSLPLILIPQIFIKDVLGYSSIQGVWGLTYALRLTGIEAFKEITMHFKTPAQTIVTQGLKLTTVIWVLVLAWRRRRAEPYDIFMTLALSWAVFFVFAPGFGAQYLIWLAPCFLVASERWYAILTAASSVALFIFYTAISEGIPWDAGVHVELTAHIWAPWMLLPWLALCAFLARSVQLGTAAAPEPMRGAALAGVS